MDFNSLKGRKVHSADKNRSVHTYIYFIAKLSALCTKRTDSIDIQHVAQCRHHRKSYALLCTRFCTMRVYHKKRAVLRHRVAEKSVYPTEILLALYRKTALVQQE